MPVHAHPRMMTTISTAPASTQHLHDQIAELKQAHHRLRQRFSDRDALAAFDQLAKCALFRARKTVAFLEAEPLDEVAAHTAMLATTTAVFDWCEAIDGIAWPAPLAADAERASRDVVLLFCDLCESLRGRGVSPARFVGAAPRTAGRAA